MSLLAFMARRQGILEQPRNDADTSKVNARSFQGQVCPGRRSEFDGHFRNAHMPL
jgi:hypothetical protein